MVNLTTKLAFISDAAENRDKMLEQCKELLRQHAHDALNIHGLRNDQFVLVCIKVDGPWQTIVEIIAPGADWQKIRDQGQKPIAVGIASELFVAMIINKMPALAEGFLKKTDARKAKCVVLDSVGCTIYEIDSVQ